MKGVDYLERARRVIELEIEELHSLAGRVGKDFVLAIELIESCLEARGKVVVLGVGKSGHIGEKIAATLTSTGAPAVVLNSLNALHGDLGVVNDGDVVLALSYSGETPELLNILPALARFDIKLIAITGGRSSTLAAAADAVLDVSVSREACPLNLAPTSSTTAMLVIGDALAMVLLEARGFRKEDFAKFHPGGTLGRSLLLKVDHVMRPIAELTAVSRSTLVSEVIRGMTQTRSGAALIVSEDGQLEGIFTHGDFARHFSNDPTLGSRPVGELMTANPVTIRSGSLAAEILQVLQRHRIDDLVVVDEDGKPVGLVDSQDLSRSKLI
ncbi:MAG: KpsF/GutQ family sugar-phosphate isomerase [Terrimicrobiaceae bacterium]